MMVAQDAACPVWVQFDGQQYCSPSLERAQQEFLAEVTELPFDRTLGTGTDVPASILYADITHPLFGQFHQTVSQTARQGKTTYRVRYRPSSIAVDQPLFIGGYGVELVLKRTDYIVIDDREAPKSEIDGENTLESLNDEQAPALKPLTTSELANLGLNAASFIVSSQDPMDSLMQVTSNFPKYSSLLASRNVSADFIAEHKSNRELLLPAGFNIMWINGLQIENRQVNAYSLLDHLRRERRIIDQLKEVGLDSSQAISLLSHEVIAQAQADDTPQRFDWRDEIEGGNVIIWMNDLERDKRYSTWSDKLRSLLQRTYPGQLPQVARDIHNLVVPVDLGNIKDIELVVGALQSLVKRSVPIRIGLVPCGVGPLVAEYAGISYYISETYGLSALLSFYQELASSKKLSMNVEKYFATAIKDRSAIEGKDVRSFQEVLQHIKSTNSLESRDSYLSRLELEGATPPVLLNGVVLPRSDTWFELMSARVYGDLQVVQQAVYQGAILEDAWVPDFFLFQAASRRNALVVPHDTKAVKIVDVSGLVFEYGDVFATIPRVPGGEAALLSHRAHLMLITDFNSARGMGLLSNALTFQRSHPELELAVLHTGVDASPMRLSCRLRETVADKGREISNEQMNLLVEEAAQHDIGITQFDDCCFKFWSRGRDLALQLGLPQDASGLWLNGRLIGPIQSEFSVDDFTVLLEFERVQRIAPVTTAITGLGLEGKFSSAIDLARVTSLIARSQKSELPEGMRESAPLIRMDRFKAWHDEHTAIHLPTEDEAAIEVVAVVDPASEIAQIWSPVLHTLSQLHGLDVKIYLNPKEKLAELPVKRFYRQVLSAAPAFEDDGSIAIPKATFTAIPEDTLFNLGMTVPPSWLVAPEDSVHDLDNIKLTGSHGEQDIDAIYELEHILIEGHSRDITTGPPPRGVQLLLGTEQEPHFTDTIIMANLGYFQFKANPGFWHISLKPGRSSKIFKIDSVGPNGYYPQPGDETTSVALLSFQGLTLYPRLSRKPGMEEEDVLESTALGGVTEYINKGASFLSSTLSSLGLQKPASSNAEINIFSVASGHLYERMLNIMMVSVMRHTTHTVKFWFIEQFLSPSFKSTLPHLAAHYGFDFEMVTYKWPHWLRGQKEKQREIWGYKILFLDVLFPLNLDKVIFVDADQIVRTDMMELNRVDLHGAPYGFTPMCDSRTEMEGFRFWKQGYWDSYLRGKPYHISALYVVDLRRFRELAAGDRLRQQYQALSADPNSLSNLDQDLPNHMQHNLPIHSLSQEWLWCETWCSDESLGVAKTIDLCNNPLTKEPKLDRARRQVPEWTEYDEEIAQVIRRVRESESVAEDEKAAVGGHDTGMVQKPIQSQKRKKDEL